jgi:hypothetical protein
VTDRFGWARRPFVGFFVPFLTSDLGAGGVASIWRTVALKAESSLGGDLPVPNPNTKPGRTDLRSGLRGEGRAFGDLLQIMLPTDKEQKPAYMIHMGEKEFAAIGFAGVQWAFLEEMLYIATSRLYSRAKGKLPLAAKSLDFSRRIGAFNEIVGRMGPPDAQKYFMKLSAKIGNANGTRQKLTHGIWSYDAKNPMRLYSRSRQGVPVAPHVEPFDLAKLWKFGILVGELSLDLDASTAPRSTSGEGLGHAYMTRSFRLAMTGRDPASLGYPWPKLEEETPAPPTSDASDQKKK